MVSIGKRAGNRVFPL
jgi:7-cyano-7-deazaguanine reductase